MIFQPISLTQVPDLMPIENACHSHPWSEKTFRSCIGGLYFGDYASTESTQQISGFYIGQYVAGEASLLDICVAPAQQGNGYGEQLLQRHIGNLGRQIPQGHIEHPDGYRALAVTTGFLVGHEGIPGKLGIDFPAEISLLQSWYESFPEQSSGA